MTEIYHGESLIYFLLYIVYKTTGIRKHHYYPFIKPYKLHYHDVINSKDGKAFHKHLYSFNVKLRATFTSDRFHDMFYENLLLI